MNIDQFEDKMILALEGDLSDKEYEQLMQEIEADENLKKIWRGYRELYSDLNSIPQDKPSPKVKERFDVWLEDQIPSTAKVVDFAPKDVKKGPVILWRKWAGAAAVFIGLFAFWNLYEHNRQVEDTLADVSLQMEELMDQQSSTARIKAIRVNYNPNTTSVDDKMIQVLIDVLNQDQSSNVRLAAVETLALYIEQERVREALISRLAEERDGGVKLSIITSLGQRQDETFKSTLEKIVNDDSQEKFVIDEAHMQLIRFNEVDI
ncbi:MAG: HEAT repeat domain-containing protein [Bacteroidota bacterium]